MTALTPTSRWFALAGLLGVLLIFGFVSPGAGQLALGLDLLLLLLLPLEYYLVSREAVVVGRQFPHIVHQGEEATLGLSLENRARRTLTVILREGLAPSLLENPLLRRAAVPPGGRARWTHTITPLLRGESRLRPIALRIKGPLGLAWVPREIDLEEQVKVFPRTHHEGKAGLVLRAALERRVGANPLSARGISTELYALREYLPGDEYRHIHWKESARLNRPVTRENTWEQHQQVVILLDCGRSMASLAGPWTKLDHALSAVLALMRVVIAQQDSASLVLFSKEIRRVIVVNRRTRSFRRVFESLYEEQAELEEADYGAAAAWCAQNVPRRSLALVCTSILDLAGTEALGEALGLLALRHRPLLVNLEDPGLIEHLSARPNDLLGAFAKTSAMSISAANQLLSNRLRSRGIDLLSTNATGLTIGMIQTYLDQKARRRF